LCFLMLSNAEDDMAGLTCPAFVCCNHAIALQGRRESLPARGSTVLGLDGPAPFREREEYPVMEDINEIRAILRTGEFLRAGIITFRYANENLEREIGYRLDCYGIDGDPEIMVVVCEDGQPRGKVAFVPSGLLETLYEWLRMPSDVSVLYLVNAAAKAWYQVDWTSNGPSAAVADRPGAFSHRLAS